MTYTASRLTKGHVAIESPACLPLDPFSDLFLPEAGEKASYDSSIAIYISCVQITVEKQDVRHSSCNRAQDGRENDRSEKSSTRVNVSHYRAVMGEHQS